MVYDLEIRLLPDLPDCPRLPVYFLGFDNDLRPAVPPDQPAPIDIIGWPSRTEQVKDVAHFRIARILSVHSSSALPRSM